MDAASTPGGDGELGEDPGADDRADGWVLSIDFGTTHTSVATSSGGRTELVELDGSAHLSSAVLSVDSGDLVVGAAAESQSSLRPDRLERTPKRRLGDEVILLGDHAVRPVEAVAAILSTVAAEAVRRHGGVRPSELRLTHPVRWGTVRRQRLAEAARMAGLPEPVFVSEPVAAAIHFLDDRIEPGAHVAVYDLGGGTFDTAVLRRTTDGFEVVGQPGGNEQLGGEAFDERLMDLIGSRIAEIDAEAWEQLRFSTERSWRKAGHDLRQEVRRAKEALSTNAEYTVYVGAPVDAAVLVTRDELEGLIAADVKATVDELEATVRRAGLATGDLKAVQLAGGSSRIPLVTRLVAERFGQVPQTWGDPKASVVLGALGASAVSHAPAVTCPSVDAVPASGAVPVAAAAAAGPDPAPAPAPDTAPAPGAVGVAASLSDDLAATQVALDPVRSAPTGPGRGLEDERASELDRDRSLRPVGRHQRALRRAFVAAAAVVAVSVGAVAMAAGGQPEADAATSTTTSVVAEPTTSTVPADPEPERVDVPEVVGMSKEQATAVLEALGFVVIPTEIDHGGAAGTVVDQNPAAGVQAEKGGNVAIVLPAPRPVDPERSDGGQGSSSGDRGPNRGTGDERVSPFGQGNESPSESPQPEPPRPDPGPDPTPEPPRPTPKPTVRISGPRDISACQWNTYSVSTTDATSGYWIGPNGSRFSTPTYSFWATDSWNRGTMELRYVATGPGGTTSEPVTLSVMPYMGVTDRILSHGECQAIANGG